MKRHLMGAAVLVCALTSRAAGQPPEDFLRRIPHQANSVSVINVKAIYSTPRAEREGWTQQQEIAGAVPIPSFVDVLMTASDWNPGSADRSWLLVQAALNRTVSLPDLAAREKATVDTLGGHRVVLTQRRGYFVELGPKAIGAVFPPDRQDVLRWLSFSKSNLTPALSPYLLEAVKASADAHVVGAMDMEELIDPAALREWLTHSKTLEKRQNEVDTIAKFAGKLKGARLSIRFEDRSIAAEIRFDFNENVDRYATLVKPLLLEALEDIGAILEEFQQAQPKYEGKTVLLRTTLTNTGLARILSMILGPTLDTSHDSAGAGKSDPNPELTASKRYYQQVQKALSDLQTRNRLATNYNFTATWHDSYAKQIDQLSQVNVDPELVKYGNEVSSKLKLLAASLRGVPLQVQFLEGQKRWVLQYNPPVYNYGWGGWGWRPGVWGFQPGSFNYDDNFAAVRTRQQQAVLAGAADRDKIWRELDDARNQIRSNMTQKFKVDFDSPGQ
jgi:hypothetical protein